MTTFPINKQIKNASDCRIPVVVLKNVCKKYRLIKQFQKGLHPDNFSALSCISLNLYLGEILGIIGRNGAGKTTLLRIINGTLSSTSGIVEARGRVLGLLNLGVGFHDELTGRDNIFLNGALVGAERQELSDKLDSIINFSELGYFIDMPLGAYSQGMRLRLAFSIIISLDFDILVIDEVLAVGDPLFQSKCFQRILELKRQGKTLVITTQSMPLIERFCDRVVVLNHGTVLFEGGVNEGIDKYNCLLNTEEFYIASAQNNRKLIENTPKWAIDMDTWGKQLGTKEVVIDSVEFVNKLGMIVDSVRPNGCLRIKVRFHSIHFVESAHFGIAVFRNDGVYCFGPNTVFDGHPRYDINPGKGWFSVTFYKVFLAPGDYKISIAIWDKKETVAFNYQPGYYHLRVRGRAVPGTELLCLPYKLLPRKLLPKGRFPNRLDTPAFDKIKQYWGYRFHESEADIESVKMLDAHGNENTRFITGEPFSAAIQLKHVPGNCRKLYLWVGIFRSDCIYCQGMYREIKNKKSFVLKFSKLLLLPGSYRVSAGIWDDTAGRFIVCHHGVYPLQAMSGYEHHGTVYFEHKWAWRLP